MEVRVEEETRVVMDTGIRLNPTLVAFYGASGGASGGASAPVAPLTLSELSPWLQQLVVPVIGASGTVAIQSKYTGSPPIWPTYCLVNLLTGSPPNWLTS